MIRRSRFVYGTAGDWTTEHPARPWLPVNAQVGGSRTSAAGIPASYIVRRDYLLELTLRVTEDEWPDLLALLEFGQTAETFLWYPDVLDNTPVEVYLEAPLAGDRFSPVRSDFPRVFEFTLTLRGADADPWLAYFPAD